MPYRPRYLIQLQARGRSLPPGAPEDHLWPAVERLNLWDLREAWAMGASPHARNGHGQGVLAALTDVARRRDPRQGLIAIEEAVRQGARLGAGEADVRALHQWLTFPQTEWFMLAARQAPHLWVRPFEGRTALHVLAAHAVDGVWAAAQRQAPVPLAAWGERNPEGLTPSELREKVHEPPSPARRLRP